MNKLYIYLKNNDYRTSYFKPPPIEMMINLGWKYIDFEDPTIHSHSLFCDFLEKNKIKVILSFFSYKYIIEKYNKYLMEKNIYLLIYSNDLHFKPNTKEVIQKKMEYNNFIHGLNYVYICANYYYCYLQFFNIDIKKIIKYPTSINDDFFIEFNDNPIKKLLLSGSITKEYPARKKLNSLSVSNINIDVIKNNIYKGYEYIKYLNNYLCCFTCCANKSLPYIVGKFFEIPSSGSLLFAYDEFVKDELQKLGFIDGINYISCTMNNMEEKINYICNKDNLLEINKIRKNGYDFVWKYHKQSNRLEYINDFVENNLIKN